MILFKLLENKPQRRKKTYGKESSKAKIQDKLNAKSENFKQTLKTVGKWAFIVGILGGAHYAILTVLTQLSVPTANVWTLSYAAAFAIDLVFTQSLKVLINFGLIIWLGSTTTAGGIFRKILLGTLNNVILTSFR